MENDERLLPLPAAVTRNTAVAAADLQTPNQEYPTNYSPFYDDETVEQGRSVIEYLNIVYKRLPIILALTIITTAGAAFYMYKQPSVFQANTQMVIEAKKPKMTDKNATIINFGDDQQYYNTQLKLLQSPDLMREVVIRLGLQRDPNLFSAQNRNFLSTIRSMVSGEKEAASKDGSTLAVITQIDGSDDAAQLDEIILSPEEKARVDAYAGSLLKGLTITQTEKTNIVNITVDSTNPDLAARVADKTAEIFIEQDIERSTQGAKKSLEDLTKSIEILRSTINVQDQERLAYLQKYQLPLQEKGMSFVEQKLKTVSEQWLTAIDDRRKIEAKYEAAVRANNRGEGITSPDFVENKMIQDAMRLNTERKGKLQDQIREIDTKIQAAETKLSELRAKYTDEMPENKSVLGQIEKLKEIKEKTDKEVSRVIDSESKKIETKAVGGVLVGLKSQLEAAQGREAQLQASYAREVADANKQGIAETRLTTLTREIETNRGLLDTYIQRQKELELAVTSSKPDNLMISQHAEKPGAPIGPNRNRNILIAFLMSLSAGIGLAFMLDYLDDSVRTSDDIGRYLGLPTLALIPHQGSADKRKLTSIGKNGGSNGMSTALITLEDNRSAIAEAYRHLRTSLLFSSAGKPPQTILVTSSQPSEGKTTTAINTAITLAQGGADVVIIDCDLRRPRLHSHFGMENGHGLTNYLSGEKETDNLLKTYAGLPKLKVITSGPIPPNPAELLSSNEMKNLLQFLKGNYKHIIIDSPPAISFTDAAIIATLVDGVILVAMAGKSSLNLIRRFKQRLATLGARIYGVVLNGVKLNSVEYNYYGYGYTSDYYNNYDESTPMMEDVKREVEETKS
jgi:capsular exopolysaccharide synthesis family protein